MKDVQICVVLRIYNETGAYSETCYDDVLSENTPEDIKEALLSGEVIFVKLAPNAEAHYFAKLENWTELGEHTRK